MYFNYIPDLQHHGHRRVKDEISLENFDFSLPHESEQVTSVWAQPLDLPQHLPENKTQLEIQAWINIRNFELEIQI